MILTKCHRAGKMEVMENERLACCMCTAACLDVGWPWQAVKPQQQGHFPTSPESTFTSLLLDQCIVVTSVYKGWSQRHIFSTAWAQPVLLSVLLVDQTSKNFSASLALVIWSRAFWSCQGNENNFLKSSLWSSTNLQEKVGAWFSFNRLCRIYSCLGRRSKAHCFKPFDHVLCGLFIFFVLH